VEAIKEGDPIYVIDAETCIDCGACADTCPSEAIVAG
jgi:NAD-dependent dihydropyrimidine dehydrogenase PreA subunit